MSNWMHLRRRAAAILVAVALAVGVAPSAGAETLAVGSQAAMTSVPTVTGIPMQGSLLRADPGQWPEGTTLTYTWFADETAIEDASGASLRLDRPEDEGKRIRVVVTGASPDGAVESRTSAPTLRVGRAYTPEITGLIRVGGTVTVARLDSWTPGYVFHFRWMLDGVLIAESDEPSFTLPADADGRRLTVEVAGTQEDFPAAVRTSEPTLRIMRVGEPRIVGVAAIGQTLIGEAGLWSADATLSLSWTVDRRTIATGASLSIGPELLGKAITFSVRGTTPGGYTIWNTVEAPTPVFTPTVSSDHPRILGKTTVGSILSAVPGVWAEGAELTYQWYLDDTPVASATASTLLLTIDHVRGRISVEVTGTKELHHPATRRSDPTWPVFTIPDAEPSGQFAAYHSAYVMSEPWPDGTRIQYQWFRDGRALSGANEWVYYPTSADVGKHLTARVTANVPGYGTVVRTMPSPGRVTTAPWPTVAGTLAVGGVARAHMWPWPSGTSLTYQWRADGIIIVGANRSTLTIGTALAGKHLQVYVTGRRPGYATVTAPSDPSARIMTGALPVVSGTVAVGATLSVRPGAWTPGTAFTYQWYANGRAIVGATRSSLKLAAAHGGSAITVKVTGRKAGFTTLSRASVATARVATAGTVSISGVRAVGKTLTAVRGTWTAGTTYSYQWYASGTPITGATGTKLVLTSAQRGTSITVRVVGRKSGYATVIRISSGTARIT